MANDSVAEVARQSLSSPVDTSSTEYLALWLIAQSDSDGINQATAELLRRQNADGGFGFWAGYASDALSTSLALTSLVDIGLMQSTESGRAISYLLANQQSNGSWSIPAGNQNNVELTAIVAHSLWQYRRLYAILDPVDHGVSYLESQRGMPLWASLEASALTLDVILKRLQDRSDYLTTVAAFADLQQNDGSFSGDVYWTALGLRALGTAALPPPDATVVNGTVIDSEFGQPIAGATVSFSGAAARDFQADLAGAFYAEGLAPGSCNITVTKPDFSPLRISTTLQTGARLNLGALKLSTLTIDPDTGEPSVTGTLRGTVSHRVSGQPLAGAQVAVLNQDLSVQTNADGHYNLSGLQPGPLQISVSASGFQTGSATADLQAQQTLVFSPSLLESEDPEVTLVGTVTQRKTGQPLANASIVAVAASETFTTVSASDGRYELAGLPAGPITIDVLLSDFHPASTSANAPEGAQLNFSPQLDLLDDDVQESLSGLIGWIVDEFTGKGLEDTLVSLTYDESEVFYQMYTGHDGEVIFDDLPGGLFTLSLEKDGYQIFEANLELSSGVVLDIGKVGLAAVDQAPTTEVLGRVIDVRSEQPIVGAVVSVSVGGVLSGEDMSGENGSFSFDALPPGEYLFSIQKQGYVASQFSVSTDGTGPLNLGDIRLRAPGIEALLPDLTFLELNAGQVYYNQKDFSASGVIEGIIVNRGNDRVVTPFDVIAFEDRDGDGQFTQGDLLLGSTVLDVSSADALKVDGILPFEIFVDGKLRFYQAPIVVMLDSGEVLAELSDVNNYASTARVCGAQQGPAVDLALCMDGSGSISAAEFRLQMQATADALEDESVVPRDGSVRLSVLQFAGSTTTIDVPPTIVDRDNVGNLGDAIRAVRQRGSGTPMASCINTATNLLLDATPPSILHVIDISTDGIPNNRTSTLNAASQSQQAGIDVLNAIGVGSGVDIGFLESIVFPKPAGGERGFVVGVSNFNEYVEAIALKIQRETKTVDLTVGGFQLLDNGFDQTATASLVLGNAGLGNITENILITLFDGRPEDGAAVVLATHYTQGLNSAGKAAVTLEGIDPAALSSGELVVVVEIDSGFAECGLTNNRQMIEVLSTVGDIELTLGDELFGPQSEVILSTELHNNGALPGNYQVALSIRDAEGSLVYAFEPKSVADLDASASISFNDDWNTGATLAGPYLAKASLFDTNDVLLGESAKSFILSELEIGASVRLRAATDRPVYHVDDTVELDFLVQNLSSITSLTEPQLTARVFGPDGSNVFEESLSPASVAPGQVLTFERLMDLNQASAGSYDFKLTLTDVTGEIFGESSTQFEVMNDVRAALAGRVRAQESNLSRGDLQTCVYDLANTGLQDIEGLNMYRRLVNVDEQQSESVVEAMLALLAGQEQGFTDVFTTSNLEPGFYACVLQALLDGQLTTLASASFSLLARSKHFDLQVKTPLDPNVLVLMDGVLRSEADGESNYPDVNQQVQFVASVLEDLKLDHYIATSPVAFTQQLRTGKYNQYLLLAQQTDLPSSVVRELEQAVLRGDGVLLSARFASVSKPFGDA